MTRLEYKDAKGGGIVYGPTVTCVMPTRNRPARFLASALKCFFEQDYREEMELLVLDDSDEPALPPFKRTEKRRVRYIWEDPIMGHSALGAKRNRANTKARGQVIVHWDDDDWYTPERVSRQVEFLLEQKKQVVGYHSFLYWREADGKGFMYTDPAFRPHAGGSSMCYWKSWWKQYPFMDRQVGEDFLFATTAKRYKELASEDGCEMLVARIHGSNTAHPVFGSRKFPEVPRERFPKGFLLTLEPDSDILSK